MKIKTNSLEPGQPKDPSDSALYEIYRAFATDEEAAAVRARYAEGIGWGDMKQLLFERINAEIAPARAEYERLIANPRRSRGAAAARRREGARREPAVHRGDSRAHRHQAARALRSAGLRWLAGVNSAARCPFRPYRQSAPAPDWDA